MSHAANIRNRQWSQVEDVPSKRRKTSAIEQDISPRINGTHHLTNGNYSSSSFIAVPTKNVKAPGAPQPVEADAKVKLADDERDVEIADSDEEEEDEVLSGSSEDEEEVSVHAEENGVIVIDSDSDVEQGSDDQENMGEDDTIMQKQALTNGFHDANEDAAVAEQEEPSFGDLLRAKGHGVIDVQESHQLANPSSTALTLPAKNRALSAPNAISLGVVLTQALRTNDTELLESCFQVQNLESIRATIERLQSSHATSLLQKLAERLHKRPGRAGSLMVWVQWTVVAHGGYLASQPKAMKELQTLYQVVRQRATGLQPLLALKGKLDMLEAQLELRRNMQSFSRSGVRDLSKVTYVEGQESASDDAEEVDAVTQRPLADRIGDAMDVDMDMDVNESLVNGHRRTKTTPIIINDKSEDEDEDEDEDGNDESAMPNGVDLEAFEDEDEDDSDDSENENFIDDEAEETGDDSEVLSDEIDYDDVDGEEDVESEEEAPAPKRAKKAGRA